MLYKYLKKVFYLFANPVRRWYWFVVRPERRGAKCVIICEGKILLVRIGYAHKSWTLPGGKVERGESFEEAAKREAFEETGIGVTDLELLTEYKSRREHKRDTIQVFVAHTNEKEYKIDEFEIVEAGWFDLDNLPEKRRPSVDEHIALYKEKYHIVISGVERAKRDVKNGDTHTQKEILSEFS